MSAHAKHEGHRARLREKFLSGEPASRSDEALLELLLTYATIKNIIDTEVMGIIRTLQPGTEVFITADHGFGPVGRERIWFDASQLNDPGDCAYLNCWLRVAPSSISLPKNYRANVTVFTPEQLRVPKKETVQSAKNAPSYTKEFRSIAFPKVGFSFSRQGSHYNPDAYSHGGISIQELVIPMVVLRVEAEISPARSLSSSAAPSSAAAATTAAAAAAATVAPATAAEVVPLPRQVCYVGMGSKEIIIKFRPQPDQAILDERRAGSMERVLTVTIGYREGVRTARKSQTFAFKVQLNSERIVRRLGNLGSMAPKGMR